MITVMGATGHTGTKITEALLKAGERVRALGRSASKLAELKNAGAEVVAGDTNDAAFLTKAFRGSDAVYTLLPTDPTSPDYRAEQDRQGEAIVKAVRESGVRYVVALSSVGADLSDGNGVIAGLHAQEERLRRIAGANVLLLRPVPSLRTFTVRSRSYLDYRAGTVYQPDAHSLELGRGELLELNEALHQMNGTIVRRAMRDFTRWPM